MKTLIAALALGATVMVAPTVTGTWTMTIKGTPHGDATMQLTLKQDGTHVTGTFISGHAPDMAVAGEFADGSLKLETQGKAEDRITFSAKLKDDGTLAGYLSSPVGDMSWSATRTKATKETKGTKERW